MNPIPKVISYYAMFLILFWILVGALPFISPETMSGLLSMQLYGSITGIVYMWGIQSIIMSVIMAVALNSKSPRFLAWMFVMRFISEMLNLVIWLSERTIALGETLVTVELKSNITSSILSTSTFGSLMLVVPVLLLLFLIPEFLSARRLFRISDALKMGYGGVMYQPSFYREWEGPMLYPYAPNMGNPLVTNQPNYNIVSEQPTMNAINANPPASVFSGGGQPVFIPQPAPNPTAARVRPGPPPASNPPPRSVGPPAGSGGGGAPIQRVRQYAPERQRGANQSIYTEGITRSGLNTYRSFR